jgi:hypothetical protein
MVAQKNLLEFFQLGDILLNVADRFAGKESAGKKSIATQDLDIFSSYIAISFSNENILLNDLEITCLL